MTKCKELRANIPLDSKFTKCKYLQMTFANVIDQLGGSARVAELLSVPPGTAAAMKSRDSIHPKYWSRIVEAARARGVKGVSLQVLADLAARQERAA